MSERWTEDAERVWDGPYVGECDNGDLWVERGCDRWQRLALWRPTHLLAYLRSRRDARLVWLEATR